MLQENKFINKVIWPILAIISLSAVVLINQYKPFIPDYDGLDYFRVAKGMNGWLTFPSNHRIWVTHANNFVSFWPITNAISVFITALFFHTIDTNLLPTLINSFYLFLFAAYLSKIRSVSYTYIATLLLCSHTLFFRLFTTFTTEFSVGLWIFAFLLTLMSNNERRGIYLVTLTILGILQRTIDIVFILMAVSAYAVIHYALWKNKQHIFITLRYVGLTLLVTTPLFFEHYKIAFEYIYSASFGANAASWKAMSGVSDRYDVIVQYSKLLFLYNPIVIPAAISVIVISFYMKGVSKRATVLIVGISLSVCIPLLMASSLNVMVVFWVYTALCFIVCELGFLIYKNSFLTIPKLFFLNRDTARNLMSVGILINFVFFWLAHGSTKYLILRILTEFRRLPTIYPKSWIMNLVRQQLLQITLALGLLLRLVCRGTGQT